MKIILAVALTLAITVPAAAQYGTWAGSASGPRHYAPSAHYYAPSAQRLRSNRAITSYAQEYSSPYAQQYTYSTNPEHDVYVNGEYVGSDPDPRIRATLVQEWRNRGGFN
jgi:hypothetical protein